MLGVKEYLDATVQAMKDDAEAKGLKLPPIRTVETENGGQVWADGYLWFLVFGRGPGKFPPPDKMLKAVEDRPEMLQNARTLWKNIKPKGLAYLIGRKIATKGTDIFLGKRPGLDILGAMEKNMPELTKDIARNEAIKILTFLKSGINS